MNSVTLNAYNAVKLFGSGAFDLSASFVKRFMMIEEVMNLHEKWKARRQGSKNIR